MSHGEITALLAKSELDGVDRKGEVAALLSIHTLFRQLHGAAPNCDLAPAEAVEITSQPDAQLRKYDQQMLIVFSWQG